MGPQRNGGQMEARAVPRALLNGNPQGEADFRGDV